MTCTEEVLRVMDLGQSNRAVAETKMNERSSRSHSVLTIIVDGHSHVTGGRTHGCLHLIDLAGVPCCMISCLNQHPASERCTVTNKAKHFLGNNMCLLMTGNAGRLHLVVPILSRSAVFLSSSCEAGAQHKQAAMRAVADAHEHVFQSCMLG